MGILTVAEGAATSSYGEDIRGGGIGIGGIQSRNVEDRTLQQVGGNRNVSLRQPLPVRSWYQGAASSYQAPQVQDYHLQDGPCR